MNLIRQRDDLKAAHKVGAITSKQLEVALSSPVFQWWTGANLGKTLNDDEYEFIKTNLMQELPINRKDGTHGSVLWPILTPFKCFRISQMEVEVYEQWWFSDNEYFVLHCEIAPNSNKKIWTVGRKSLKDLSGSGFAMWMDEVYADIQGGDLMSPDGNAKITLRIGDMIYDITRKQLSDFASDTTRRLGWFLYEIYGAGNTVVKVNPKPDQTKSVQWRQAREHYLVLRRQQVIKLRESKGTITDEDIVRAAHWRRAHLRRLSSNKFVNKRGLLVPVKQAWIGPTEWQGNDGKIYTVVGMNPPSLTGIS